MKAIVIGVTDKVGKVLTRQLLCDERYSSVTVFVESPWKLVHDKLELHVVDFSKIDEWDHLIQGDIAFCCLLSSLRKTLGFGDHRTSEQQFVEKFAASCLAREVNKFVLLSVRGINVKDRVVYGKTHKQVESIVKRMNFVQLAIVRPTVIFDPYLSSWNQRIGFSMLKTARRLGFRNIKKPVCSVLVANSLRNAIKESGNSFIYLDNKSIIG